MVKRERIRVTCDICGEPCEVEGPEYPLYICPECDREKWEEDEAKTQNKKNL